MKVTALFALSILLPLITASVAAAQTGSGDQAPKGTPAEPKATIEAKVSPKVTANPMVVLETTYGNIKIELFKDKAPISVDNFLSYVNEGYYDSTIVHRVVKGFVLQAGGFTEDMKQKPQKPSIKNEATNGLSNLRGTLSMARTGDINSGSSHFFINLVDNMRLDHTGEEPAKYGYAVFGKVAEGMDVVDKIALVEVAAKSGYQGVPVKPVIITAAKIAGAGAVKPASEIEKKADEKKEDKKAEAKKIGEPETKTTK
jgi:cyclophilin family peptidyl-prolyl cis-trans isomerase